MKKSERLFLAMLCVLDSGYDAEDRLEILETLMDDRKTALFVEQSEEGKE